MNALLDEANCHCLIISNGNFRFVDLFAGLGGFRLAAERFCGDCVFASEINGELRDVYFHNFGAKPHGDIRDVKAEEVPPH